MEGITLVAKSGKEIEAPGDCDILILDKTGTITEGSRSANEFVAFAKIYRGGAAKQTSQRQFMISHMKENKWCSFTEEKRFIPPLIEKILTARKIEFSAETRFRGLEFMPNKRITLDTRVQEEAQ